MASGTGFPGDCSLSDLTRAFRAHGARRVLVKTLAANDNPKNQFYVSGSWNITNLLPSSSSEAQTQPSGKRILKSSLHFSWLRADGSTVSYQFKCRQRLSLQRPPRVWVHGIRHDHESVLPAAVAGWAAEVWSLSARLRRR